MPDVDHRRAGLDPVALDHLGPPHRRHHDVGAPARRRADPGCANARSSPCSCRPAAAAPSACRRCSTARSPPPPSPPAIRGGRAAAAGSPSGVQGTIAFCPVPSSPTFETWNPSTSLAGSMALMTRSAVEMRRAAAAAPGCRGPPGRRSAAATSASSSASDVVGGQPVLERGHPGLDASACPWCGRRPGEAGSSPTSTTARPGVTPCSSRSRATSVATWPAAWPRRPCRR